VTSHRQTLDLPYRPEDLFDLVSDVGRYPEFIKWIRSLRCLSEHEEGQTFKCRAEATVGFQGFTETFITDVDARRSDLAIDVSLVRGPFRKLSNSWRFAPGGKGTKVEFAIQFEFRNFVLQTLADANKAFAVRKLIEAFETEAARRYQRVPAGPAV
jgi:coenzyme Q-binding protein COQ10